MTIEEIFPHVLSVMTIIFYIVAGNNWKWTWQYAVFLNIMWLTYGLVFDSGFILMGVFLIIAALWTIFKNYRKKLT